MKRALSSGIAQIRSSPPGIGALPTITSALTTGSTGDIPRRQEAVDVGADAFDQLHELAPVHSAATMGAAVLEGEGVGSSAKRFVLSRKVAGDPASGRRGLEIGERHDAVASERGIAGRVEVPNSRSRQRSRGSDARLAPT